MKKSYPIGELEKKIFIQNGFFYHNSKSEPSSPLHRHHYAEIHVVTKGKMCYWIENQVYTLNSGDIILIPAKKYHNLIEFDNGTVHTAFQVDVETDKVVQREFPLPVLEEFFNEIRLSDTKDNYVQVIAYVMLICAHLIDSLSISISRNFPDSLAVSNFFEQRYHEDVRVSDLANELFISERQAQLLVKRITGRTFRQELTAYRMKIAKYLEEYTDFSMAEIAFKVGFRSYSGFWKVYKAYKEQSETTN